MSIGEQIETIVASMTNNNIPTQVISIKKVYPDNTCDIITMDNNVLRNVRCSSSRTNTETGLLLFENGKQDQPFVLLFNDLRDYYTKEEIDDIISGDVDLKDYVKKTELVEDYDVSLDFNFGLSGRDDTIRINTAIIEKIKNTNKELYIGG